MNGQRPVVLFAERYDAAEFFGRSVDPGLIHKSERDSGGALFQRGFENVQHTLMLLGSEGAVLVSGYACTCRAVPDERCDIAGRMPVNRIEK